MGCGCECVVGVVNEDACLWTSSMTWHRQKPVWVSCPIFYPGTCVCRAGIWCACLLILSSIMRICSLSLLRLLFVSSFWLYLFRYLYCSYLQDCWRPLTTAYAHHFIFLMIHLSTIFFRLVQTGWVQVRMVANLKIFRVARHIGQN